MTQGTLEVTGMNRYALKSVDDLGFFGGHPESQSTLQSLNNTRCTGVMGHTGNTRVTD